MYARAPTTCVQCISSGQRTTYHQLKHETQRRQFQPEPLVPTDGTGELHNASKGRMLMAWRTWTR